MAARSKAQVCGRLPAEIVVSNPTGGMDVCLLCVVGLITRPEESYREWCVVVCDLESSWIRRHWPSGGCCAKRRKNNALNTILPLLCYSSLKELVYLLTNIHTELRTTFPNVTSSDVKVGYSGKGMPYRFWETCSLYNFTIRIEAAGYCETSFLTWRNSRSGPRPPHCRGFAITLKTHPSR